MKQFYLLVIAASVITSVSAQHPSVHLIPEAPEGHYEQGREYVTLSGDSILAELGFDGLHGESLVFDLAVVNRTDRPIRIDPAGFYYVLLDSATADSSKLPPRMALHPERVLHQYNTTLESREEDQELNAIFGFIEAGIELIANTTAFITTDDPGYIADALFSSLGTAGYYVTRDAIIGEDLDRMREELEVVSEEIFRLSEVPPGKVASGFVFFPGYSFSGHLMFCFPLEDQLFQFVYLQERDMTDIR